MDKRRAIKMQYKEILHPMGVYQIKNIANGRIFIGSSMNLSGKANSYRAKLEFDSHHHEGLREDLKQYGYDKFFFEILETINQEEIPEEDRREAVAQLEEKWLVQLQPYGDRGYNKEKKPRQGNTIQ